MKRLRAENISLRRGERYILRRFHLQLEAGEILHLRGENGSGKSSLLQALAGLNPPAAGRIEAQGTRLYLGHGAGIQSALTVQENLYFFARLYHGWPESALDALLPRALEALNLQALAARPCRYLSAGQQRRVQLARLWLSREDIWLLDEPLNALDAASVARLLQRCQEHARDGGAVVLTSHQDLPAHIARRECCL